MWILIWSVDYTAHLFTCCSLSCYVMDIDDTIMGVNDKHSMVRRIISSSSKHKIVRDQIWKNHIIHYMKGLSIFIVRCCMLTNNGSKIDIYKRRWEERTRTKIFPKHWRRSGIHFVCGSIGVEQRRNNIATNCSHCRFILVLVVVFWCEQRIAMLNAFYVCVCVWQSNYIRRYGLYKKRI